MEGTITKITCPELSKVYERTRLFEQLDAVRSHPAIWITGPPGAGKTTLVASYLARHELPCLWYQVDEGDADIANFFHYLGLATKQAVQDESQPLPVLTPEYLPGLSTFTRRYFEALCTQLPTPYILVFDNYQQVPADTEFHNIIQQGLGQLPPGCQSIIISRSMPPPAFARWQANRDMVVLGWDDLRLTEEETCGITELWHEHNSSNNALDNKFCKEADGWAAGLVLMLERTRHTELAEPELSEETTEILFDYFAGEIFVQTDKQTQTFLLQTALLPDMTVAMAEQLTGLTQAGDILSELNRKHYFTERRMRTELVYQYHPLFRDFLLTRAHATIKATHLTRLKQTAANLLIAANRIEDAVDLLREIGDWQTLGQLVGQQARIMITQGRHKTLQTWLNGLPEPIRNNSPWLLFWLGTCRLPFDPTEARDHFEMAFKLFDAENDVTGLYLAWAGVVDTFFYEWGDFMPLDPWIEAFGDLQQRYPAFPSLEIKTRVSAAMFGALMFRQPHHPEMHEWEQTVTELMLESDNTNLKLTLASHLLLYYIWLIGDGPKAERIFDAVHHLAKPDHVTPFTLITWYRAEAAYHWMTASAEAGLEIANKGLQMAQQTGVHSLDYQLLCQCILAKITQGDTAEAAAFSNQAMTVLNSARRLDVAHYHYLAGIIDYHRGDSANALENSAQSVVLAKAAGVPFGETIHRFMHAHALFENGQRGQALVEISRARRLGKSMHSPSYEFGYLNAMIIFALKRGKKKLAINLLRKAMPIARQQNYVNRPLWSPAIMFELFTLALKNNIEVEYVQNTIRKRKLIPNDPPLEIENWPWAVKVFTLGRFAVLVNGQAIGNSKMLHSKPLDILKAVIALGGRGVREETITDALWPDAEADAAHHAFETALYRLRKLIGVDQAISLHDGQVNLDPRYCWVDVWSLERRLGQLEATIKAKASGEIACNLGIATLALYQGPFLSDAMDQAWSLSLRERLHNRLLRTLGQLGNYCEKTGDQAHAIDCYQRVVELDPLAEEFYQRLISCYHQLGRCAEALAVYHRCRDNLHTLLDVEPSSTTEALYETLQD